MNFYFLHKVLFEPNVQLLYYFVKPKFSSDFCLYVQPISISTENKPNPDSDKIHFPQQYLISTNVPPSVETAAEEDMESNNISSSLRFIVSSCGPNLNF